MRGFSNGMGVSNSWTSSEWCIRKQHFLLSISPAGREPWHIKPLKYCKIVAFPLRRSFLGLVFFSLFIFSVSLSHHFLRVFSLLFNTKYT